MNILVTGASGQLGAALTKALVQRGDTVRCLLRKPEAPGLLDTLTIERIPGDVTDPESLKKAVQGQEAIFHCAGIVSYWSRRRPELHRVNIQGTQNLLDAAAQAQVRRFIITSSIAACGYVEGQGEGDENTAYNWDGLDVPYAEAKYQSEQRVIKDTRMETMALRPGIIWGEGDINENAGRMIRQLKNGQLKRVPSGSTTMAVLEDVVAGHLAALDRGYPGGIWILGGTTGSFFELMERIARVVGTTPPVGVLPDWLLFGLSYAGIGVAALTGQEPRLAPNLAHFSTRNRKYSSVKAEKELEYRPSSLEAGVASCYNWYLKQNLLT